LPVFDKFADTTGHVVIECNLVSADTGISQPD